MSEWYLRHQRQEQQEEVAVEERLKNRLPSSHVHNQQNSNCPVPMPLTGVNELTWEDVVTAMQTTKPTWYKDNDTLESIVHQVTTTYSNHDSKELVQNCEDPKNGSISGKWGLSTTAAEEAEAGHHMEMAPKRLRSEDSDHCGRYYYSTANFSNNDKKNNNPQEEVEGSATFCTDHDSTKMSWPSSESLRSVKTKASTDDLSNSYHGAAEENRNDENETKGETVRSQLVRNGRAAASHNQAERRRRDRINQKMKALQKLVPNASKTDKASMLDEIIGYLKQLQAQVKMMSARNMSQMILPLGMHQQLQQMSLMARMGMNSGLGMTMGTMFDINNIVRSAQHQPLQYFLNSGTMAGSAPTFVPPPFVVPPAIPACSTSRSNIGANTSNSVPCSDNPYAAFLAHSMNIDMYNKMEALLRHQAYQSQQTSGSSSHSKLVQGKR